MHENRLKYERTKTSLRGLIESSLISLTERFTSHTIKETLLFHVKVCYIEHYIAFISYYLLKSLYLQTFDDLARRCSREGTAQSLHGQDCDENKESECI